MILTSQQSSTHQVDVGRKQKREATIGACFSEQRGSLHEQTARL